MNAQDVTHAKGILKGEQLKFKFWRWVGEQIEVRGRNKLGVVQWHVIVVSIEEVEALQTCVNKYNQDFDTPEDYQIYRLASSAVGKLSREYYQTRRW